MFKRNFKRSGSTFACAANGNLDNMKWLLENNFSSSCITFSNAALNGNLDNMKCLLGNNFGHFAALNGNLSNMKWLLKINLVIINMFLPIHPK